MIAAAPALGRDRAHDELIRLTRAAAASGEALADAAARDEMFGTRSEPTGSHTRWIRPATSGRAHASRTRSRARGAEAASRNDGAARLRELADSAEQATAGPDWARESERSVGAALNGAAPS